MTDRLRTASGRAMARPEYHADLKTEYSAHRGVYWKLERAQRFNELGDDAWDAFVAGDWDTVLEIFEGDRDRVRRAVAHETESGIELRRLRIVEHPPSPYLRWELHSHKVFAECGRPIRVLDAKAVADREREAPLPELLVLADFAMYRVHYTADMTPDGATRFDDPDIIREANTLIEALWHRGEPLLDYFHREITPLGPPTYAP